MGELPLRISRQDAMWGPMPAGQGTKPAVETATGETVVAEILGGKKEFSLGDLNPLIHTPRLTNEGCVNSLKYVVREKIKKYDGIMPKRLESTHATSLDGKNEALRFVARFEVDEVTPEQMEQLEDAVRQTYKTTVRTRTGSDGNNTRIESYPPLHVGEKVESFTRGWYMGPNLSQTDSLHQGLFFFRDYGKVTAENLLEKEVPPSKYVVEIREADLYQTDLVQFVSRVSAILGKKAIPPEGDLLYEVYYDLMRLGLKKTDSLSVYGMDDAINQIKRGLLTPLASQDLSQGVSQEPESVLMVGVPGTGKTLVVEQMLHEDTGVLILPLNPQDLATELQLPKEKQRLLPRIANVASRTGRKVVLQIDDIENMLKGDKGYASSETHATMLNLMAGIRDSGFYVWASTNYPEKIDPSLLQPQRFGILIYTGLQDDAARREILKIHATPRTRRLGADLFLSDEARDITLDEIVKNTEGFTPRYLAEIATVAKSNLVHRVGLRKGTLIGLTEEDLEGETFTLEDWEDAFREVSSRYDKQGTQDRDRELRDFVIKHSHARLGFGSSNATQTAIFSPAAHRRFTELRSRAEDSKEN